MVRGLGGGGEEQEGREHVIVGIARSLLHHYEQEKSVPRESPC